MTLISAIYGNSPNSKIGGRGRNIDFFLSSLRNIKNLDLPLVMFCPPEDYNYVDSKLSNLFKQYKLISFELSTFEFFNELMDLKEPFYRTNTNDRNETLCFLKAYWVKTVIESNPFNDDKFVWIDSGLFHHGIIPERVGGVELLTNPPDTHYYPHNSNSIFTPTLGENLKNKIPNDTLFFCALDFCGDPVQIKELLYEKYNHEGGLPRHLVAGIFGGKKEPFLRFFELYRELLKQFIERKIYCLEEQIFSAVYALKPEYFTLNNFTTWWFYAPNERCGYLSSEGDSFYKIFERIHAGQ